MSTSPANDRCRVCQRAGVHLLIGEHCTPCRVQAGHEGEARVRLPPDLPGLLGVPPDAPALAFTRAGGPEWPGYAVELLVVGRGHATDSRPLGDPLGREERGYLFDWVDPPRDGRVVITRLVAHAFRARVYLDAPRIWLEHLGAVGGYEEEATRGAIPKGATDAQAAVARALRGRVLLHETAPIGRPPGAMTGFGDDWRRIAAEVDRLRRAGVTWAKIADQYPGISLRTLQRWHKRWLAQRP